MKQCPQCNYSCEDQDVVCKNCGYLFSASNPYVAPANDPQQNAQNYSYNTPPSGYGDPNINNYNQAPYQAAPKNNGLAIASLVLGIVGVVFCWCYGFGVLTGIVGLILGIVGMKQIKKTGAKGRGLALTGIITSGVAIVAGIIFLVFIIFAASSLINNPDFWNSYSSTIQQYSTK
jgi:uncharacterized membrane protein YkgB